MKKSLCFLLAACLLFALTGCGKTKTLHCDSCNKEVKTYEKSEMDDDWIIYCNDCHEELFGDDPILGGN